MPEAAPAAGPTGFTTAEDPDDCHRRAARQRQRYAENFDKSDLPLPPAKKIAIVACMDARLNPYGLLGLAEGDAHVIHNAGSVIGQNPPRHPTLRRTCTRQTPYRRIEAAVRPQDAASAA